MNVERYQTYIEAAAIALGAALEERYDDQQHTRLLVIDDIVMAHKKMLEEES